MKTEETIPKHHIDPITGAPHSHPVATGVGALGGAATGVTFGAPFGPVGSIIGGAIGAAVGGFAGHAMGDKFDPYAEEEAHWKDRFETEPYYEKGHTFEDYGPAYRLGYGSKAENGGKAYADAESDLSEKWEKVKGRSKLGWDHAKHAAHAGWKRMEDSVSDSRQR